MKVCGSSCPELEVDSKKLNLAQESNLKSPVEKLLNGFTDQNSTHGKA